MLKCLWTGCSFTTAVSQPRDRHGAQHLALGKAALLPQAASCHNMHSPTNSCRCWQRQLSAWVGQM
jgi:hypothetical protein